jgi:hypothetical protein
LIWRKKMWFFCVSDGREPEANKAELSEAKAHSDSDNYRNGEELPSACSLCSSETDSTTPMDKNKLQT